MAPGVRLFAVMPMIKSIGVDRATQKGTRCLPKEVGKHFGKMVIERVPSVEMVRFCNSGTEVCLSVLRVMRAHTGREKIIKFEGCYHRHAGSILGLQVWRHDFGFTGFPGCPEGCHWHDFVRDVQRHRVRQEDL